MQSSTRSGNNSRGNTTSEVRPDRSSDEEGFLDEVEHNRDEEAAGAEVVDEVDEEVVVVDVEKQEVDEDAVDESEKTSLRI